MIIILVFYGNYEPNRVIILLVRMKMKFLFLWLFLMGMTLSCSQKHTPSVAPMSEQTKIYTYLALGDSYTIGESVRENERFPMQLVDSLKTSSVVFSTPRIIARTGWTSDELKKAIETSDLTTTSTFDMVTLLIGVNNQYRGRSVEAYKPEFTDLLNRAIQFAGGKKEHVIVVSIPDYAYTPFGRGNAAISKGIDEYNAANEAITKQMGVAYINITPISREGLNDPLLVASDALHPSGKQYSRWVELIKPVVLSNLK